MSTSHWSSRSHAHAAPRRTTVVCGRLLGDDALVETELTREGDDYEILADVLRQISVPPPPRVVRSWLAPILPPARRSLPTR